MIYTLLSLFSENVKYHSQYALHIFAFYNIDQDLYNYNVQLLLKTVLYFVPTQTPDAKCPNVNKNPFKKGCFGPSNDDMSI